MEQPKSLLIAYLLWFFLGFFGLHRFYLDDVTMGVVYLVCFLLSAGIVSFCIWIYDLFAMPVLVRRANRKFYPGLVAPSAPPTHY